MVKTSRDKHGGRAGDMEEALLGGKGEQSPSDAAIDVMHEESESRRGIRRSPSTHRLARSSRNLNPEGSGGMTLYVRRNDVTSADGSPPGPASPPGGSGDAEDAVAQFWSAAEAGVIELPHEVLHDTMAGAMHGVVNEAVQQAVTAAMEERDSGFNVRANLFTLFAITGVIFFWRGVWTLWDALVGMSVGSGVLCLVCGLVMMMVYGVIRSRWEREEEAQEASKDGTRGSSGSDGGRGGQTGHHHERGGQMDCFL